MKKVLLTAAFLLGVMNISFAQRYLESVNYMESTAREYPIDSDVMTIPIVADLEVLPRIEEKISAPFENVNVTSGIDQLMPSYKAIALAEAANKYDADLILGALVKVETTALDKGGRIVITVSGYPARYVKFRNATQQDIELIRSASTVRRSNTESVMSTPDNKSTILKEKLQIL